MADTITRYLKLKIADNLSADAKYNLQQIDSLGATTVTSPQDDLLVRSRGNVLIEPESADIGGLGNGSGSVTVGKADNKTAVQFYSSLFNIRSALSLLSPTNDANKISLAVASGHSGAYTVSFLTSGNSTLTIPAVVDEIVTKNAAQELTYKTLDGNNNNTFINIPYTSLLLTGNIVNADISNSAAIVDTKLATITSSGKVNTSAITGTLPVANGGTGNDGTNKATALLDLLPSIAGKGLSVLRINITENGIEWATGAGVGTVTNVSASAPLTISGDSTTNPTINLPVATSLASGYLSSTDWSTFNAKEGAISTGTTGQYWRGDKSWQTLDKSAVGLSNVDNTSDANKPISSATQSALDAKYDSSNPSSYVDATGAKNAAVVDSTAGSQTDQAPSVSAIKSYITSVAGGALSYTWAIADGATKTITHSLNKATVSVTVYDENGEDILVDTIDRTSSNAVSLTSSVAPTGDWTVVIRP